MGLPALVQSIFTKRKLKEMTKDKEGVFDELSSYFEDKPDHFNIFEEEIDVNVQMEYYKYMEKIAQEIEDETDLPENAEILFSSDSSEEDKKKMLVLLSNVNEVEAYRTIEKFVKSGDKNLRPWAIIAMQQSRMLLESSLLDEKSVFISTGLGGKGNKLRYFCVLFAKDTEELTDSHKKILKNEIEFAFKDVDAELEKIEYTSSITCFKALIPIEANLRELFDNIIAEVNNYGNFLKQNMIVTNVKSLTIEEINKILKGRKKEEE